MSFKYAVLGTGVGKAIAYMLIRSPDTKLVTLGDVKDESAKAVAERLNGPFSFEERKCKGIKFVAEDRYSARKVFRESDVVVSALPARYNPDLAKIAVEEGKHFCDLGGVVSITRRMEKLNRIASVSRVSVIPDCGLMPGLGVMLAKLLMEDLEDTESVRIYAGGLPQKPQPPLFYQRVFSLEGLAHICFDSSPILMDGVLRWRKPFSDYEILTVSELATYSPARDGKIEAFTTAGASIAPWTFQRWGVNNFWEKTVRWPGFVEFIRDYRHGIKAENFEEKISPYVNIPVNNEYPDLVWLRVGVSGTIHSKARSFSYTLFDRFDEDSVLSAMERTTGFPTALLAQMAARGKTKPGVHTPECALTSENLKQFFNELRLVLTLTKNVSL